MGYVYATLWFVVGLILIFKMARENKAFFAVGGFFLFWGVWQLLNELLEVNMYDGILGWIHKGIAILALALCAFIVYIERKKSLAKFTNQKERENTEPENEIIDIEPNEILEDTDIEMESNDEA